jgi:hypothetical protein
MKYLISFAFSCILIIQLSANAQTGGETCATATVIASIPYQATGNTSTALDDYFASCQDVGNNGGAKDLVYEYTNGSSDVYLTISLCQAVTNYDCQVYIYEGSCTGTPVGCQEDGCQSPAYGAAYNSTLVAQLFLANTTYYIVVDGYDAGSNGDYQINISESIGISPPAETNIPLILIDTYGNQIVDEPKINTNLKIINNGPGALNHPTDVPNVYNGYAGIEIRGAYSASLPQKPYGIETWDVNGNNNNVSLLGMPIENDWILIPNYNDKTFLRNVLAFNLFTQMGHYAPRTQLVEVVVNNIYEGVYVFTEKIKRDKNRIDIAKLDLDDNAGDSLTGGYIFKVDYWNNGNSWPANYDNPNYPGNPVQFVYDYPAVDIITAQQKDYIQTSVENFEDALWGTSFNDPVLGYRSHIDVKSFIDYFIVNEFSRNGDGFKKSRRFHKNKDSKNPLILAGPVWDFDWAYKDMSTAYSNGAGWMHSFNGGTDVTPPGWYIRLMQDTTFANELACTYFTYRQTILDKTNLNAYIDSLAAVMDQAQERHYERWPILGVNVGTPEIGSQPTTYAGEITKFKTWISDRIDWLDANMPGNCPNLGTNELASKEPYWNVYPNPTHDILNVYVDQPINSISISDASGKIVQHQFVNGSTIAQTITSQLNGVYLLKVELANGRIINTRIVCQ